MYVHFVFSKTKQEKIISSNSTGANCISLRSKERGKGCIQSVGIEGAGPNAAGTKICKFGQVLWSYEGSSLVLKKNLQTSHT